MLNLNINIDNSNLLSNHKVGSPRKLAQKQDKPEAIGESPVKKLKTSSFSEKRESLEILKKKIVSLPFSRPRTPNEVELLLLARSEISSLYIEFQLLADWQKSLLIRFLKVMDSEKIGRDFDKQLRASIGLCNQIKVYFPVGYLPPGFEIIEKSLLSLAVIHPLSLSSVLSIFHKNGDVHAPLLNAYISCCLKELEAHKKSISFVSRAFRFTLIFRNLSTYSDSSKLIQGLLNSPRDLGDTATFFYLVDKWPKLWDIINSDPLLVQMVQDSETIKNIIPELQKRNLDGFRGFPESWEEAAKDASFSEKMRLCAYTYPILFKKLEKWIYALHFDKDRPESSYRDLENYILDRNYVKTVEIILDFFNGKIINVSDLTLEKFLEFTYGEHELIVGMLELLHHLTEAQLNRIFLLNNDKKFRSVLIRILTNEKLLQKPDTLIKFFNLEVLHLKRLLSLMCQNGDALNFIYKEKFFNKNKEEFLLQLMEKEPSFIGYMSSLLANTKQGDWIYKGYIHTWRSTTLTRINYENIYNWYLKDPQTAKKIFPIATRYPIALGYIIDNSLNGDQSFSKQFLETLDPKISFIEAEHIMRLIESKQDSLALSILKLLKVNFKGGSNLLDLAVAGHIDLAKKILNEHSLKGDTPFTKLILKICNSSNADNVKMVLDLATSADPLALSLLGNLMATPLENETYINSILAKMLHAYCIDKCYDSIKLVLQLDWNNPKNDEEAFFISCAKKGDFKTIEFCLKEPIHKKFRVYCPETMECLIVLQTTLKAHKEGEKNIEWIQQYVINMRESLSPKVWMEAFGYILYQANTNSQNLLKLMQTSLSFSNVNKVKFIKDKMSFRNAILAHNYPDDNQEQRSIMMAQVIAKIMICEGSIFNKWLLDVVLNDYNQLIRLPEYFLDHATLLLSQLKQHSNLFTKIKLPLDIQPEMVNILRNFLDLKLDEPFTDTHAQQLIFGALLSPIRQKNKIGNCFCIAVGIKLQTEISSYINDLIEILFRGKLTRTTKSRTKVFPVVFSPELGQKKEEHPLNEMWTDILANMGLLSQKKESRRTFKKMLNKLTRFSSSENDKNIKKIFKQKYREATTWFYDPSIKSQLDKDGFGCWTLYNQLEGKKIDTLGDYKSLWIAIIDNGIQELDKDLSAEDRENIIGLKEFWNSAADGKKISSLKIGEKLWRSVGGHSQTVLSTYYGRKEKSICRQNIEFNITRSTVDDFFELFKTLPLELQKRRLIIQTDDHAFTLLTESLNVDGYQTKQERKDSIEMILDSVDPILSELDECNNRVLTSKKPTREIVIEGALEAGGLLEDQVKKLKRNFNDSFFEKDGESGIKYTFPLTFADDNFVSEGLANYIGVDLSPLDGKFILANYKKNAQFNDPTFIPRDDYNNSSFEILFI